MPTRCVELNRIERRATRNGRMVDLTVKEFGLLEYLMQRSERVCSWSELLREVWQMSPEAETNVVDVYINYLRKKLGAAVAEEGSDYSVIMTECGEGYRMGGKAAGTCGLCDERCAGGCVMAVECEVDLLAGIDRGLHGFVSR